MARKISQLTAAGALTGAEHVWVEQSGNPVRSTTQDIADLASGGLTAGTVTSSTLRWNGSAWVENTVVKTQAAGTTLLHANPDGTSSLPTGTGNGVTVNHNIGLVSETASDNLALMLYHNDGTRLSRCGLFSQDQGQWGLAQSWSSGGQQDFAIWMGNTEYARIDRANGDLQLLNGGTVLTSNGNLAGPAYTFVSDPNSGLYLNTADTVGMSAGGTQAMLWRSTYITSNLNLRIEQSEGLHFEGSQHRITYNDGAGNFNIRHNNYYNTSELYSSTGKACHLEFSDSTSNDTANLEIAAYASGTIDTALAGAGRFYFYNSSHSTMPASFYASNGSVIAGSELNSASGNGVTVGSNFIRRDSTTDALRLYGGSAASGANIELYGSSHASTADWAVFDATSHYFRDLSGATVWLTINTSAITAAKQVNADQGLRVLNGFTQGSVVAASTTDLTEHIALYGTAYGLNVTASNLNFVANNVNFLSSTSTAITSKINHDFSAGIDVTGQASITRSGGGAKDMFSITESTGGVALWTRYTGTNMQVRSASAGGGNAYVQYNVSTGAVQLYYGNNAEVRTVNSDVADAISGLEVHDYDQNFRPVGFGDMVANTKSAASAYTLSETDIHKTLRVTNVTGGVTFPNDSGMRVGAVGWIINTTTSDLTLTATTNNIEVYFGDGTAHATGNFTLAGKGWCTWRKQADSGTAAYEVVGIGLS